MRCKGCKFLFYVWDSQRGRGFHACDRFKVRGDLIFGTAAEAYDFGCQGKRKRPKTKEE